MNLISEDYNILTDRQKKYLSDNNIEIIICPLNLRPHLKYFYSMQKYSDYCLVTIDDDTVYTENMLEILINEHIDTPDQVLCGRCHKITYNNGKINNYRDFIMECKTIFEPSHDLLATGVGGVLYPEKFCKLINNDLTSVIYETNTLTKDDVFLKYIEIKNDIKVRLVGYKTNTFRHNLGYLALSQLSTSSDSTALWRKNVNGCDNDTSLSCLGNFQNFFVC